ncbi:MAG: hypothetical protein KF693_01395 [Nitrospira sp.]|nr:hypothetical protein [Nitrospira sp.]
MNCSRCQGLLVRDHFLDFDGTIGHMWASGYRCMNCGNVLDPVIEKHRLAKNQPALTPPRHELPYEEPDVRTETHAVIMRAA